MPNSHCTALDGPCTLSVWATGHHGWGDGSLALRVDVTPDDGVTWIPLGTYSENQVVPLDLHGVLLRSQVVRRETPVEVPAGGVVSRWRDRRKPKRTPTPRNDGVALHVAVRGPGGASGTRWGVSYPHPEAAILP